MINVVSSIFNWLKDSTHRIFFVLLSGVFLLLALIGLFLCLSKYPITYHTTSTEIRDHIRVTKDDTYVLRTQVDREEGAVVSFSSRTYYNQTED